ncbi:MAG: hypothetical protein ED555_04015 [Allomuricauda sp.]|nr:MAG: hypothetical protein ED555_04015 [Allomuricauda sp.]
MGKLSSAFNQLVKSEFSKNVSSQILGTGMAQVLPFLVTPLLTRLYTEDEFALYTSFFALSSIFAVGVGGKYHTAIVLPKTFAKAMNIFWLSIYITMGYALLLALVFVIFYSHIGKELGPLIYFIPVFVLFYGLWMALSNLSIREKRFKFNAIGKVLQSLTYVVVAAILGVLKITFFGLVLARALGVVSSSTFLFWKLKIRTQLPNKKELRTTALKYIDYPKFGVIPAFLNTISSQALILVLDRYYLSDDLGNYGLTYMVLAAPLALIGNSFKDVFYQKIGVLIADHKKGQALLFFKRCALALFLAGLPICISLLLFGQEIFEIVFGAKWGKAGLFASILAISFFIKLVVSPLSSLFNATNRLNIASRWQTAYFFSTFITLGLCATVFEMDVIDLMYVYVAHEIVLYILYFVLEYFTLKKYVFK